MNMILNNNYSYILYILLQYLGVKCKLPAQNSEEPKNINIFCKERVIACIKSYQSMGV
jgi:hypothetical protein